MFGAIVAKVHLNSRIICPSRFVFRSSLTSLHDYCNETKVYYIATVDNLNHLVSIMAIFYQTEELSFSSN